MKYKVAWKTKSEKIYIPILASCILKKDASAATKGCNFQMNFVKLIFSFLLINHVDTTIWYGTTTEVREPRVTLIGMFPSPHYLYIF